MICPPLSTKPYYLASPYTHADPAVMQERWEAVKTYAGPLMIEGYYLYCPILHTHPVALDYKLPPEFEWWEGFNRAFISISAGVIVADIEGWETSRGVRHEI